MAVGLRAGAPDNFNPRSHEGSDYIADTKLYVKKISIHAPTKGATKPGRHRGHPVRISIHAPTKGAT